MVFQSWALKIELREAATGAEIENKHVSPGLSLCTRQLFFEAVKTYCRFLVCTVALNHAAGIDNR